MDKDNKPITVRIKTTPGRMMLAELLPRSPAIPFELVNRQLRKQEISHIIDEVYRQAHTPSRGKAFTSTQKNDMTWHGLRSDMTGRLHEITVPTLLVHGAQDSAVPLSYAQKAHTLIKNSELVILQDCGHWAQREKPEEFHQVVSTFLDK